MELSRHALPASGPWVDWFPGGSPGTGALAEHARTATTGRWWADRPIRPRAIAVSCAGHVLLRGDPRAVDPGALAPLTGGCFDAPDRFLPVLGAAFHRITPWERMMWLRTGPAPAFGPPPGATVRRLTAADRHTIRHLGPDLQWVTSSWGGALAAAASGHVWGAFRDGRLVSLAGTYFLGSRYEDLAAATAPDHRGQGLALACVTGLCADISARGHEPSWTCSRDNRPSRRLAWAAGFRLVREYVHHVAGAPAVLGRRTPVPATPVAEPRALSPVRG
ncbi:GNAT family N-acetyltransferase [Streptomyces sp. RKAG293]|nr:GNAT family N-acetyltransferase [Streptomyces sp. RKAG293]